MRLKSIGIANFKAYGPTVQIIPIRPITLLFGANSSGKSSLLHSLLWLNHASTRRDADVFQPVAAEKTVHLGGFDACVHQSSKGKPVKIYLELDQLDISKEDKESFLPPTSVRIGLEVNRRSESETPSIIAWELSIDEQQFMRGKGYGPGIAGTFNVNWAHPFLQRSEPENDWENRVLRPLQTGGQGSYSLECHGVLPSRMYLDILDRLTLDNEYEEIGLLNKKSKHYSEILSKKQFINKLRYRMPDVMSDFLGGFIEIIERLRYLPPLRSVPERFENLRTCTNPSWRMLGYGGDVVSSVNRALEQLDVPHRLEVRKLVPETNRSDASDYSLQLRLLDKNGSAVVDLQDVGVGTGQVLPLIIESIVQRDRLIIIEQPEVHIHPRLQAELGDVFIESALGENKNTFLLETHSEHLILRILRRIRESTEKDFSDWSEELKKACGPHGIRPEDVAVLYVQPGESGAEVIELPITPDGGFSRSWPGGFFEEQLKEFS